MISIMEFVFTLCAIVISYFFYMKWNRRYWRRKNVPYIKTNSLWGNVENPLMPKDGFSITMVKLYNEFKKKKHKHAGIYVFNNHVYFPINPELIRNILTKGFAHFVGHGIQYDAEKEPISGHLGNLTGDEWKNMRGQLSPTFTSGKMKMMFNTLLECGLPMIQHIDKLCEANNGLDIKEILGCYTTDVIGSCAFGLDCNSFKDPNSEFRRQGRKIFRPTPLRALKQLFLILVPSISNLVYIRFFEEETETFFINTVKSIMNYRETNNFKRNDFMQLFVEMNEKARINGEKRLTTNEIAAQAFAFFGAGFETSSMLMTFCLHELAFNQDIQGKLREEIMETIKKHDGKITYDGIMSMKYMDMVVNETLRKYPGGTVLDRHCNKNFQVPDTDLIIEKGTRVLISVLGLHRDEEYYPNPDKFDPERFNEENKAKRPAFTFLPFGEGPRMCIGLRFGVMQAKTGLSLLLTNYKISPAKGENYHLEFDPRALVLTKKTPIMLMAEKIYS